MSKRKLRLLHLLIQPVFVWDDGEQLTPGPETRTAALPLPAAQQLLDSIDDEAARYAEQLSEE